MFRDINKYPEIVFINKMFVLKFFFVGNILEKKYKAFAGMVNTYGQPLLAFRAKYF